MGDTDGWGCAEIKVGAVGGHLHWPHTGNGGSVGDADPNIQGLHKEEATLGPRKSDKVNIGGYFAGGQDKAEWEGHTVGYGTGC